MWDSFKFRATYLSLSDALNTDWIKMMIFHKYVAWLYRKNKTHTL